MVLKGVLRDVHVFAFIYHKCSPALSPRVNVKKKKKAGEEEGKEEEKSPPKIKKKLKKERRGGMKNCLARRVFLGGIPLFSVTGRVSSDGVNIT